MKILLDPQIFYLQKFGGISRLFSEVWLRLKFNNNIDIKCPIIFHSNFHLVELNLGKPFVPHIFSKYNFKGKYFLIEKFNSFNKMLVNSYLSKKKVDIFLATYYQPYFAETLNSVPLVLTVFDMIHEIFPQYFELDKVTIDNKRLLIYKAKKIIAISNQTKEDILKFYPDINEDKIEVVYLAQSIEKMDLVKSVSLPKEFLLFVGNRDGYKNFEFTIRSLAIKLREGNLKLICAGGGAFKESENNLLKELGIKDYVFQKNFNDNELYTYYHYAKAFIFPSLYEGFGIPILEAMKCGCPVILSDIGCFREIAQDAAIFFQIGSPKSLLDQVNKVLTNQSFRENLIQTGKKREKDFSWNKTSEGYLNVINKVMNE